MSSTTMSAEIRNAPSDLNKVRELSVNEDVGNKRLRNTSPKKGLLKGNKAKRESASQRVLRKLVGVFYASKTNKMNSSKSKKISERKVKRSKGRTKSKAAAVDIDDSLGGNEPIETMVLPDFDASVTRTTAAGRRDVVGMNALRRSGKKKLNKAISKGTRKSKRGKSSSRASTEKSPDIKVNRKARSQRVDVRVLKTVASQWMSRFVSTLSRSKSKKASAVTIDTPTEAGEGSPNEATEAVDISMDLSVCTRVGLGVEKASLGAHLSLKELQSLLDDTYGPNVVLVAPAKSSRDSQALATAA